MAAAVCAALVACDASPSPAPAPSDTASETSEPPATTPATAPPTAAPSDTEAARSRPEPLRQVRIRLQTVARLTEPIAMAVRPDDDAIYIAERAGTVRALRGGKVAPRPVLDITEDIAAGGERGLLGITFSADGRQLIASYTNTEGDSRLEAFPMRDGAAVKSGRRQLLAQEQPYANHNGGNVITGPDGMLYLGLGDGGGAGDPEEAGQDPSTLLGKLLRLDPRDGSAPRDNPFVGEEGARPEIFATGLRNPWRFSFDRETGALWLADVGQSAIEEVNVTPFARSAGRNFGWDDFEGTQAFEGDERPPGFVTPAIEYPTGDGCAVTGGYVYRGSAIPGLQGAYLYSDYCAGWIRAVRVRGGKVVEQAELATAAGVASFGEDGRGELYVLSLEGTVSRIIPR